MYASIMPKVRNENIHFMFLVKNGRNLSIGAFFAAVTRVARVARVFIPKIPIWVSFVAPGNEKGWYIFGHM
jgi:hypothetical protein